MYIIFFIILIFLILELYSYKKYKNSIFYKTNLFVPHYFCHFILNSNFKNKKIKINKDNFRYYKKKNTNKADIYLSGDCSFFEKDLHMNETLGYILEKKNFKILNPSCPHYSINHQLNRLIFDLKNRIQIKNLLFSASVNDVISLLNNNLDQKINKNTFYKSFDLPNNLFPKIRFFYTRYFFFYIFQNYKKSTFRLEDKFITKTPWKQLDSLNYKVLDKNFKSSDIVDTLKILNYICKEKKINLILSTFAFEAIEMNKYEHRRKILFYLKKINKIFRVFAKKHNIKLIDFEQIFQNKDQYMRNKWDFNFTGNKIRRDKILKALSN